MEKEEDKQTLKQINNVKKLRKNSKPKRSRLYRFKAEIILFRQNGYSYEDIRIWLRRHKRTKVTSRTINYFYENHCK